MKRAVGYVRISKAETRSLSLEYQQIEIEKLAQAKGYELVAIFSDDGISGKRMDNRPGFQSVLSLVNNRSVDALICWRSDRVSRKGIESLNFESLLSQKKIAYHSVMEGLIGGSTEDPLQPFLRAGLNERERIIIAQRTKRALARKREKGEKLGANPYGQNATEKALVERIHRLHRLGFSSRKMLQVLIEEGFSGRRGKLHKTTILNILNRKAA